MGSKGCIWARIPAEQPWAEWWPEVCSQFKISDQIHVEKVQSSEMHWSRLLDSAKTLSLFAKQKAIVIFDADKAIKSDKNAARWIEELQQGPHWIVLHSSQACPKSLNLKAWESPKFNESLDDDKASFRWIDHLHNGQLSAALVSMETALSSGQHPLALLQLAARDFRLGRLIHYAKENRLGESELVSKLKVSPYMIKKWMSRPHLKSRQWNAIFEKLWKADLDLKSGNDEVWVLRKLSLDLSHLVSQDSRSQSSRKAIKKPSPTPQPLWPTAPSFA